MSPGEYRTYRLSLGLTQAQLATALGLKREKISRRETGAQAFGPEAWLAILALARAADEKKRLDSAETVTD